MAVDLREQMRLQLAKQGIDLAPPAPARAKAAPPAAYSPDRDAIRAVLLERGAHPDEIDWLTNSAPSLEAARAFNPTRKL